MYKGFIKNDMTQNYLEIVNVIYTAYWLPILLATIFLILGFIYMFYFNISDNIINKMAQRNEQRVKK